MAILEQCVIRINSTLAGASEVYTINPGVADAEVVCKQLAQIRANLLPDDCNIVDVKKRYTGLPPNSEVIPDLVLPLNGNASRLGAGYTANPTSNVASDAIQIRFKATRGTDGAVVICNRLLRFAPDQYIARETWESSFWSGMKAPPNVWGGSPERAAAGGFTAKDQMMGFMEFLIKNCGIATVNARGTPSEAFPLGRPTSWIFGPYTQAMLIRPCSKRVGRPWGPFQSARRSPT